MRKIKLMAILLFVCGVTKSQIYTPTNPTTYGSNNLRLKATTVQHIPVSSDTLLNTNDTSAQIRIYNGKLIYHYGYWRTLLDNVIIDTSIYELKSNKVNTIGTPNSINYLSTAGVNGFVYGITSGLVPYGGATSDVNLGIHGLTAISVSHPDSYFEIYSNGSAQFSDSIKISGDKVLTERDSLIKYVTPKQLNDSITIEKAATDNNYTVKPINYGNVKPKIKKIVFIGDSNGKGHGLSDSSARYPTQLCNILKCVEVNNCVTGMTMQRASPVAYGGSIMTQLNLVPYYDTSYSYLSICLGTNDVNINNGNYTAAGYRLALDTLLTNAITTKGWPANAIILNSAPYVTNLNYAGFSWTYARLNQYRDSLKSAATAYGTLFFDETTITTNNFIDSTYFQTDGLHFSVKGQQFIAMAQASIFNSGTIYGDKQITGQLAVGQIKDAPQWYTAIRTTSNVINGFQEIGYIKYLKNVSDFIEITINATDTLFRLPIYFGDTYSPSGRLFIVPINSWMPNNTWINIRPDFVTGLASGWELSGFEAMQLQMKLVTPSYKDSRFYFRIVSLRNGQAQTVNVSIRTNDRAYSSNFIETYATGTDATAYNYFGGRTHFSSAAGTITEEVRNYTGNTFNAFAGYALNTASSYTARSFTDKKYVDSIAATKQATITAGRGITLTGNTLGLDTTRGYTWTAAQTFSASLLNLASSTQIKFGNNSFLSSDGNGTFRFGFVSGTSDGVISVGGFTSVTSIAGGFNSGTNTAGSNLTISPRDGTGTGTPGNIDFNTSNVGSSGSTAQSYTTKFRLFGSGNVTIQSGGTFTDNGYKLEIPTGNVKFGGSLEIGNTVNTVSPTSPNRTVTIVIAGVTYYLPAKTTND